MTYRFEIEIGKPLKKVWEFLDNPRNLPKWQPTIQQFQHLSGHQGEKGARSELIYQEDGKKIRLVETIIRRKAEEEFTAKYEDHLMKSTIRNRLEPIDEKNTRLKVECEIKLNTLPLRLISPFIGYSIRKRTGADLSRFKAVIEKIR